MFCKFKCCKWAAEDPPTSCHQHFARDDLLFHSFQLWGGRLLIRMTRIGTCQDLSRFWSPPDLGTLLRSGGAESHIWFRSYLDFSCRSKWSIEFQKTWNLLWTHIVNLIYITFLKMRRWNGTTWGIERILLRFQQLKHRHQNAGRSYLKWDGTAENQSQLLKPWWKGFNKPPTLEHCLSKCDRPWHMTSVHTLIFHDLIANCEELVFLRRRKGKSWIKTLQWSTNQHKQTRNPNS